MSLLDVTQLNAQTANISGGVTAASATISGGITGSSATISGGVTAVAALTATSCNVSSDMSVVGNVYVNSIYVGNKKQHQLLETQDVSSANTIVTFNLTQHFSNFTNFELIGSGIVPTTDAVVMGFQTASDTVPTYNQGATDYWYTLEGRRGVTGVSSIVDGAPEVVMNEASTTLGNAAGETYGFTLKILNPANNSLPTSYFLETAIRNSAAGQTGTVSGACGSRISQDTTYIRFYLAGATSTFSAGKFMLYGY